MGKTSSKSQTSQPTDPAVEAAYNSLLTQGQNLASQPLNLYSGQLVAPLNATQNSAINQIQGAGSLAQPYLTQAANYATQGATPLTTTPFTQANVDQYYSPYQNDVINSTMALQNQQDAQQQQSLAGNITAAGAWGGDRSAVLQSELAGQQSLANNSSIANLENQDYSQALGQFNTTNQQNLQTQQENNQNSQAAGYELGSLGTSMENSALTGASALLNAGTLQQQVEQENLNVPYEQYLQQQAYPYQSADFLAGLLPGVQQGTGTTTNSTSYNPFNWGSLVRAGSAYPTAKDGGRVHLASGGAPYGSGGLPYGQMSLAAMPPMQNSMAPAVPTVGSYVPSAPPTANAGMSASGGQQGGSGGGGRAGADGSSSGGMLSPALDAFGNGLFDGTASGTGASGFFSGLGADVSSGLGDAAVFLGLRKGGRAHLSDGGAGDVPGADAIIDGLYPDTTPAVPAGASALSLSDTPVEWRGQVTNYADAPPTAQPGGSASLSNSPTWDDGTPVVAQQSGGLGSPTQPVVTPPAYHASPWRAVLAGLGGFMAHGNIGAGINAGLAEDEKDNNPAVDHSGPTTMVRYSDGTTVDTGIPTEAAINARAMNDYRMTNMDTVRQTREDAIAQRAEAAKEAVAERAEASSEAAANRANQLRIAQASADQGRYQWQPGTQLDPTTNQPVSGMWRLPTRGGEAPQFIPGGDLTGKAPAAGGAGGLSGREGVFFNRITGAANSATAAAKNIMELPSTVNRGFLGGVQQGPGIMDAMKSDLSNEMTSSDAQEYNTMMAGVSRNLSAIEAAGLAPNGSLTHSMDSLVMKAGDTQQTKMRKMAEMRQIIETGLTPTLSNPRIPPEQKQLVQGILGQIQSAIPFTQHDITALEQAKDPRSTIMDFAGKSGLPAGQSRAPAPAVTYLKAHPESRSLFDAKYGAGASAHVLGN